MVKPKPTRFKVGDKVFIQGMPPLDSAPAEPEVPAVVAHFYQAEDEHRERETALPASMVGPRRDIKTYFAPTGNEDYGDEEE